jgi:hypothetical protein
MDERIRQKLYNWIEKEGYIWDDEELYKIVWLTRDEMIDYSVFVQIAEEVSCKEDPEMIFHQYEYLWMFADYINKILPFQEYFELKK